VNLSPGSAVVLVLGVTAYFSAADRCYGRGGRCYRGRAVLKPLNTLPAPQRGGPVCIYVCNTYPTGDRLLTPFILNKSFSSRIYTPLEKLYPTGGFLVVPMTKESGLA
jgi:hypothetical protein